MMKENTILNRLRVEFAFVILLSGGIMYMYESELCAQGAYADDGQIRYYANVLGVLIAMLFIPLSLKLLNFRGVRNRLSGADVQAARRSYRCWSEVRMAMLAISIWMNLSFYYTTLTSSGLGCALISFFALLFCWPSREKMRHEMGVPKESVDRKDSKTAL